MTGNSSTDVVDHILHLAELKLTLYTGGYETYLRTAGAKPSHISRLRRPSGRRAQASAKPSSTGSAPKRAKHVRRQSRVKALAKLEPIFARRRRSGRSASCSRSERVGAADDHDRSCERRLSAGQAGACAISIYGSIPTIGSRSGRQWQWQIDLRAALLAGRSSLLPAIYGGRAAALRLFSRNIPDRRAEGRNAYEHSQGSCPRRGPKALRARLARFWLRRGQGLRQAGQALKVARKPPGPFALIKTFDAPPAS